jgi:hypothetical protein
MVRTGNNRRQFLKLVTTGVAATTTFARSWASDDSAGVSTPFDGGTESITAKLRAELPDFPGASHFVVLSPDGSEPTESALRSHRYHHHTVAVTTDNLVWVGFSSSGSNEDASGQMVLCASMNKKQNQFGPPIQLVPPQSAWAGNGNYGGRISCPRNTQNLDGRSFIVSAIDEVDAQRKRVGVALVANECKDNGSVGPVFRISEQPYKALPGFADIPYDSSLGPALYAHSKIFGLWGGSMPPPVVQSDWIGWVEEGGESFTESTTIELGSNRLFRLWRKTSGQNTDFWWGSRSNDTGRTWGNISITDIPNAPSAGFFLKTKSGKLLLIANAQNKPRRAIRDPLFVMSINGDMKSNLVAYAVRQHVTGAPIYRGIGKGGGASYPGGAEDANHLWVSYSLQKETIAVSKLPIEYL